MKTKYSQLTKVKKQKVDSIENEIAVLNARKQKILGEIERIKREISGIKKPKEGRFGVFLSANYSFETLFEQKKQEELLLSSIDEELNKKREEYKRALMEYEKIKYLEDLEIEKKLDKIKKDEQKLLDEMSVVTYKRRTL